MQSYKDILDFGGYRDPRYATLAMGALIVNFGLYTPYYYIEPYVALTQLSSTLGSYLLPMLNGSSLFGRVLGGHIADKIGRLNVLYPMTLFSGVLCFALWLPAHHISQVIVFTCLYGFSTGVFISLGPAAISQISPEDRLGARMGAFSFIMAFGTLIGTPIGGAIIHDETLESYTRLIIFAVSSISSTFYECHLYN